MSTEPSTLVKKPGEGSLRRYTATSSAHDDYESTPDRARSPQSHPPLLRIRHVLLHDRRPLRPRRASQQLRPRHDPALPPAHSTLLVHPHLPRRRRAHHRNARASRLLSLAPPHFPPFLRLPRP